jgi:hypothetical protein
MVTLCNTRLLLNNYVSLYPVFICFMILRKKTIIYKFILLLLQLLHNNSIYGNNNNNNLYVTQLHGICIIVINYFMKRHYPVGHRNGDELCYCEVGTESFSLIKKYEIIGCNLRQRLN